MPDTQTTARFVNIGERTNVTGSARFKKLILADEATGNLDPDNKLHILDLLFEAVDQHGATLLAVTHDHGLLPRFDRMVDFNEFRGWSAA